MKRDYSGVPVYLAMAAFVYLAVASITFQLRHPWMTDTERFLYFGRAIVFGSATYDECRPRQ
jgi:hypothetical protein